MASSRRRKGIFLMVAVDVMWEYDGFLLGLSLEFLEEWWCTTCRHKRVTFFRYCSNVSMVVDGAVCCSSWHDINCSTNSSRWERVDISSWSSLLDVAVAAAPSPFLSLLVISSSEGGLNACNAYPRRGSGRVERKAGSFMFSDGC